MSEPTRSSALRNLVFDLGGVLIDWDPRHLYRRLFNGDEAAMDHFLATVCTRAWHVQQDAGRSTAAATAELLARHPEHRALIEAFYDCWDEMTAGLLPGAAELLESLARRQVPLYALSNWPADTFPRTRAKFPILGHFHAIVISGEIGVVKPDRRIFDHLLETQRLAASECLFIDDVAENVAGARAAGLSALQFQDTPSLTQALRELGFL